MEAALLLWGLTLLSVTTSVVPEPHYLVAFPAVIRYPNTEKFCVLLRSLPENVHLEVMLEMKSGNHTLVEKDVEKPHHFECISFQVPLFSPKERELHEIEEEVAHVHVHIHKGDSVSFEGRKKVLVRRAHTRHIIEPDKPFYKPGETVKFRIVRLDEDFKAIKKNIPLVLLKDPNENRIGQWLNVETKQGIAEFSFPLASEAVLGEYTIVVGDVADFSRQRYFGVAEYVLPKFEVSFEVPPLVTTSDTEIRIKVTGKYTYGKGVRGTVRLSLKRDVSFYFFEELQNGTLTALEKEYTAQTDKTGCAFITIDAAEINLPQKGYADYIKLSAELEEEGTGTINSGYHMISLVTKTVEVSFINLNPFYKHGFPYTGKMKCGVNGVPVQNQTIYLTVDVNDVETHLPYTTDENGEVHFSLDTAGWKETLVSLRGRSSIVNVSAEDAGDLEIVRKEAFTWLKPFYSESNSFLEIQHVEEELPCGKDQEVLVDYILDRKELGPNADHVDFYYLVVSRGNIVLSGQKQVPIGQDETLKGTFALTLPASIELAPIARLLLYAVFEDGEVAADVDVFTIEKCFRHQVTLAFSQKEHYPDSTIKLQVDAAPGALCSLQALDKSVILKNDRTLTAEEVYDAIPYDESTDTVGARGFDYHLEDFEPYPCLPLEHPQLHGQRRKRTVIGPWYESQADVYSLFKQLRMKVLTNTKVKKPVTCEPLAERHVLRMPGKTEVDPEPVSAPVQAVAENVPPPLGSEDQMETMKKPRTRFPETWIWDLVSVNEEGKASLSLITPDTITEWQANAFCVADVGFGLAKPASLQTFQPYFVDLTLPYSVVRGETFELRVTVFNYMRECMQVEVSLVRSQQFRVESCSICFFTTCLCADEAKTFSWNVTATHLGHVKLMVTTMETRVPCGDKIAVESLLPGRSDAVVKSLLVKPEGVLKEETHNAFLCSSGDPALEEVSLTLPAVIIEDTGRATISVIGDILGPALQDMSYLLQMPFGCGEQNMVKFVPNIFILRYLEATNQATPEIKAKATEDMKSGYQRQLLYKHDGGSYSTFGKEDTEGNTWLTAFVARAFGQAKSYVFIDDKHIHDAVHWLEEHQLPSGCFQNVGRLFNNALQGGVDDDFSLTAYVTAALLELHLQHNGTMVEDALACLKRNLSFVNATYPKALSAYTFTLAGDMETRQQLLTDLKEHSDEYEAETAAYVLLALISKPEVSAEDIKEAFQVVRTLIKQQNPYGGFYSTQDTVVSLQALSRYAALTYKAIEDVKVLVKSTTGFQHEFHVDKGNQLVLQEAPLPEVPGQYTVEVSGSGCAYVQSTLRYNHPPEKTDAFALIVETSPKECNRTSRKYFDIHLQVSYTGERESSNMALIEVNLVSGFIPVKKSVNRLEGKLGVKKVEFDPDKISLYLDQLDKTVRHYHFSVEQEVEVIDLKPATVKVYDYYHPEDYAEAEYKAPCSTESTKQDSH
ncbi:alpha-2-macroglobulin-like protein 1 [Eublepharis macularius]|uniref:Alpha-2-macroglobulin-like protein 1 n=1 Tax=Eublepharis macularius TaxID=481883 RepID=A0AA97KLL0_EUBMA|nr:alpha-2-macroglobulin-like protein 1 [Eublepharis macularius]